MNRSFYLTSLFVACALVAKAAPPDFEREVYPILQRSCIECHGTNRQAGDLRLDNRQAVAGNAAVVGDADGSELVRRIQLPEGDMELMPAVGERLSASQQSILKEWVAAGAPWPQNFVAPKHWAYIAPQRPGLPAISQPLWPRSPIDHFVLYQLDKLGLKPSPPASPEKLLRRLHLDLIGLPPSLAEIDEFARDPSDERLELVVDELLARPQFGERWARAWLDAARYADSHGFQRDNLRAIWAYRDWVIRALNTDMPFDQFTIEQLAGDLLPGATEDQKIATGFHRSAPVNVEAGSLPEETRIEQVIDRVNTTAAVWLGTTLECCQCHDHKYDPFTQREYYQLLAFFNNTEVEAERKDPAVPSSIDFKSVSINLSSPERDKQRDQLIARLRTLEQQLAVRREEMMATLSSWAQEKAQSLSSSALIHPLKPLDFRSQGTTDNHTVQEDGTILLQGNDPPEKDTYLLKTSADLNDVRGFRLDVLQHESLPGGGPGRGDAARPNFVLSSFVAKLQEDALKFKTARASFSQKNQAIEAAIDASPESGWAIAPRFHQDHWAVFELNEPLNFSADQTLSFELVQNFGSARTIGCFRISAITGDIASDALPHDLAKLLLMPDDEWDDQQRKRLLVARSAEDKPTSRLASDLARLKSQLNQLPVDTSEVMVELPQPRMTHVFVRGDYKRQGEVVEPGTPARLHANLQPWTRHSSRLDLARWLVDRRNPLVARVTVNRWWGELFGSGLVKTPEDFGMKGEAPTHPELLDWLACEYMDNGWSLKQLLKTIVLSSSYRQSSHFSSELLERDPQNNWLARGPSFRMDAEMIRDNALSIGGLISLKQFGPAIHPYQPEDIWKKVGGTAYKYEVSDVVDRYRRGVYVVLKRGTPYPSFINFDANARNTCTLKRSRSNTSVQALTLLNDPVYVEAASALAERLAREYPSASIAQRATAMFRTCTGRFPSDRELVILTQHVEEQLSQSDDHHQAWQSLATILLNLHETICKD